MSSTRINKIFPSLLKKKKKKEVSEEGKENQTVFVLQLAQESPGNNIQDLVALSAFWRFPYLAASQPGSTQGHNLEAEGDAVSSQEASTAPRSQTMDKTGAVLSPS